MNMKQPAGMQGKDLAAARNLNPVGPKHILLSHKYDSIFITYFESFS